MTVVSCCRAVVLSYCDKPTFNRTSAISSYVTFRITGDASTPAGVSGVVFSSLSLLWYFLLAIGVVYRADAKIKQFPRVSGIDQI